MNKINWIFIASAFVWILGGCKTLDTVIDNLADAGGPVHGNRFEKGEMQYEVDYCTLFANRDFECGITISNFNQTKSMHIGSVDIRDDTGKQYRASINPAYGMRQYYPGERFTHKVSGNNVSTQATSVSAVVVGIDMRGGRTNTFREAFTLQNIPMRAPERPSSPAPSDDASTQEISSDESETIQHASGNNKFEKGEMSYEANYCTLLPSREFECDITISNFNQTKSMHIVSVDIRDDNGKAYRAHINPAYGMREYYPGERFTHKVLANNVSTEAKAVSAIFAGIDLRGDRSSTFREEFLLYDIPMRAPERTAEAAAETLPEVEAAPEVAPAPAASPASAPTPATTPAPAPVVVQAQPPNLLLGCWKWSNGMQIEVQEDGGASNGFAPGAWEMKGAKHYTIAWPDFTGQVSLSADGQSLRSADSIGTSSTAVRLHGDPSAFIGSWRWDNGGIVVVAGDGTMSAGPLKGTWSGSGKTYSTAWPIVDAISVSADGKKLSGQNQFGAFTATKMSNCRQ